MAQPPSSPQELISTLSNALSPAPSIRSDSLALLNTWATLPGYFSILTDVFASDQLPTDVRLQAALQFKNGVDKFWRKSANYAISPDEKAVIRPRLLSLINEPSNVLAKTVALSVAKIARLEYGTEWNEFPHLLLASLQSSSSILPLHRTLLFLHQSLKSLSSNRTARGQNLVRQLASLLFPTLRTVYESFLSSSVQKLQAEGLNAASSAQGGAGVEEIDCAALTFKCLSIFEIYGYSDPSQNVDAKAFFVSTVPTFTSLVKLRLSLVSSSATHPPAPTSRLVQLTKHVIAYTKLYHRLVVHNAKHFEAMGVTEAVVEAFWTIVSEACQAGLKNVSGDELTSRYPTKLLVLSLLLLKSTTSSWDGATPLSLPPGFVASLTRFLIEDMLPIKEDELAQWDADPEGWINEEEESDSWQVVLRPCAEYVLRGLIGGYPEELGPLVAAYLQNPRITNPQNMEDLLLKESVYTAVGRSPSDLATSIDFNAWLNGTLVAESAGTDANYRIIRRRIAWILGNLILEDLASPSRSLIYSLVIHFLSRNDSTDLAIRLTAARSLKKCDTWDFDRDAFLPFLRPAVEELVHLMGEVELSDSLKRLNETLGIIIDRVGEQIEPYAAQLASVLGALWASAQEPLFQTSVLVTFTKLTEALGEKSQALLPQAGPIIEVSVDSSRPSHVYLQEDGLELWQVLLRRTSAITPDLAALVPLLMNLIVEGLDVLPRCLSIFESYLLLDAPRVLEICSSAFFNGIAPLLDGLRLEAVKVVLHAFNTVFQASPPERWANEVHESGCFERVLEVVTTPGTPAVICTKYLCSISRIILASTETFRLLIASAAGRRESSPDEVLSLVLEQFIERLDNMSSGGQRKLVALALANLVTTTDTVVLSRLADLVALWSGVMAQTEETDNGDAELYHVPDDYTSDVEVDYTETLETQRKAALSAIDPITTHKLSTFIGQRLSQAQALNGGPDAFQETWLSKVDPIVVEELVKRLNGTLAG
ncbi:hypothetical protein JCM10212_004604 [Sporobolomyces blumeae]